MAAQNMGPGSLQIGDTGQTLSEAYKCLGVEDTSIPDGDIVAAFYASYTQTTNVPSVKRTWSVKALEVISHRRQSQLLAFILTIIPHLTLENVCLLATKPSPDTAGSSTNVKTEVAGGDSSSYTEGRAPGSISPDPEVQTAPLNLESSQSTSGKPTHWSPFGSSNHEDTMSMSTQDASSTGITISMDSEDSDSADSDFDEPIGGKFWDGRSWRCEDCNEELVHGRCPNGDTINPCHSCGRDFEPRDCSKYCSNCHAGLEEQCTECARVEGHYVEGLSGNVNMAWDEKENVWRCTTCLWEVEANSEDEGHCHCLVDSKGTLAEGDNITSIRGSQSSRRARTIELLYYHHYEPADSDSSGTESNDSQPDSEDEAFIEDDGPYQPGLLTLLGPLVPADESQEAEWPASAGEQDRSRAGSEPESMDVA